ncbi:hypothetical protein [Gemmatimonas sp.]|uniref:hypothetical protein n=1 Tax=Gemmatimonas sp. TaxID=1962908 RepID=UPI002ED7AD19
MRRIVALSALFAGVLLGCDRSTEPAKRSPLRLSLDAPATVVQGDMMRLTITITNSSSATHTAVFPGSVETLYVNAVALSTAGDTAWASPGWVTLPAASMTFAPGGNHSVPMQWALIDRQGTPVAPGTYRLKAWLPTISSGGYGPDEILHSPETPIIVVTR